MDYFSNQELGVLNKYAGKNSKGTKSSDLELFFKKLHSVVADSIKNLPFKKENIDNRRLIQGAGQGKGYKYKDYLWIKIFFKGLPDDMVFFNLTYNKNGSVSLFLDYKNSDSFLYGLYMSSSNAQAIKNDKNNIQDMVLSRKSESDIITFISSYLVNKENEIIAFYNAFKIQRFVYYLNKNYNIILTGAPGTGKTYLALDIATSIIGCNRSVLQKNQSAQFAFVQFHPSYDYTDFVEGLRPKRNTTSTVTDFERQNGIFKEFCSKAALEERKANQEKRNAAPYVFVIDEINRGEISKIFGELFFSIDPGYRTISKRIPVKTQYQNLVPSGDIFENGFYVPENVYVIGTMNDIDRSVESMDFAFRRRFAFYEVKSKDTQESILSNCQYKDDAIKRMDNLNAAIENQEGFSSAYHIGASYFNKIDQYKGNWDELWERHLKGVLYEYLRGLPDAMTILDSWKESYNS